MRTVRQTTHALTLCAAMADPHEPSSSWWAFARLLLVLAFTVSRFSLTTAQPATLQFSDCFSSSNTSQKVEISAVYAQFFPDSPSGPYINFTVIGSSPQQIIAASDGPNPVASKSHIFPPRSPKTHNKTPTRLRPSDTIHDHRNPHLPTTEQQRELVLLRDAPSRVPPPQQRPRPRQLLPPRSRPVRILLERVRPARL